MYPLSTAQPTKGAPQVTYIPQTQVPYSWYEDIRRNTPQTHSLAAATMICASGGMSLAWSFTFAPGYKFLSNAAQTHMKICWFVAVIIGASIATILIQKITKRVFNLLASLLVIVYGLLCISEPESLTAAIIARYCNGYAFGLILIPTIVAASEQSVKRFRGLLLSFEQFGLISGMTVYTVLSGSILVHGIAALIYGTLALVFSFMLTIESPIFYQRKDKEADAIIALCRLQKPHTVTTEIYTMLHENKHLLQEDAARGRAANISASLIPMVKICVYRAIVSLSFSLPLTWAFHFAIALSDRSDDLWRLFTFATMRVLGVMIARYYLDMLGRRGLSTVSLLVGGGLLVGVGSLFSSYKDLTQTGIMKSVMSLLMAYQFFAGMAAPASTCYLGEAFSVSVKPYFILVVVIFENLIQIIVCCTFGPSLKGMTYYGYYMGGLQIVFAVFFFFGMPETKQTTLREALTMFKKNINTGTRL